MGCFLNRVSEEAVKRHPGVIFNSLKGRKTGKTFNNQELIEKNNLSLKWESSSIKCYA